MLSLAQRSEGVTEALTVEGDQRLALLERSYKGEHVELEIVADTYAQGDDIENRNDVGFSEDALRHLVGTAAGTPFQRDHSLNSDDAGGMSLGAELVEQNGVFRLRERLHLVTPWAVRAALQGTMAKFSISVVTPWADMFCSCGAQILECDHFPGEDTSEHGRIIWIHRSAEWVERSWVVRPAVPNTGILAWESLAEARTQARNPKPPAMPRPAAATQRYNVNELLKLLKLDAAAGEQMITEKVRATLSELEGVRAQVTDLKTELETNTKELEQARAELADVRAKELDGEAETEVKALLADGRIRAGGKQEELVRTRYKAGDIAGARALVAALKENPRIAPVGARQSIENSTSTACSAGDTQAAVDYKAAFAALPDHIRGAARAYAENPQRFFEIRPDLLPGAGN